MSDHTTHAEPTGLDAASNPVHPLRCLLAGLLETFDRDGCPEAMMPTALALDELVYPSNPPAPWDTRPIHAQLGAASDADVDAARVLDDIHHRLGQLIDTIPADHPAFNPLAFAMAGRHIDEALLCLAAEQADPS